MNRTLLYLALIASLSGCGSVVQERLYFQGSEIDEEHPATYLGLPLTSGQIVLGEAPGAYSFLFGLGLETYVNFTHAAILIMEEGKAYVYEMTGEYDGIGLEDTPTDGIRGFCRRLTLEEYAHGNLYVEVYDLPPNVDAKKVIAYTQDVYERQPEFDAYLDYSEHEKLFCTEFVALALEAGGHEPFKLVPIRQHPDYQRLLTWFKVERKLGLPAASFADESRWRASLGQLPCRTSAYSYFAAKAEVSRRFTADQKLGNVFRMEGIADIRLRDEILMFLNRSLRLFPITPQRRLPLDEIQAKVRALADEMFGSAEDTPPS
ncbi:MAG: hypothetical protein JKY65_32780 [Planctomycetes bacterium]|nr:hypothetical protein [Planctomycetota bacterium]